jgi:hypothetical protein
MVQTADDTADAAERKGAAGRPSCDHNDVATRAADVYYGEADGPGPDSVQYTTCFAGESYLASRSQSLWASCAGSTHVPQFRGHGYCRWPY